MRLLLEDVAQRLHLGVDIGVELRAIVHLLLVAIPEQMGLRLRLRARGCRIYGGEVGGFRVRILRHCEICQRREAPGGI
jgi:hypothetical protein